MSTVSRTDFDVHLGFWTEWGQGRINGATLTLTRRDGGFLMSFVAIFIALSGKSLWRICCFIIHRSLSTTLPQDGLHHQRQAILRNADTPEGGAWKLAEALIAWRKHARRPILRLLPLALLAFVTFTALLIGGIFSSRVATDGGSEVLLTGKRCGPATSANVTTQADSDKYFDWQIPYTAARATAYSNYAMQCYTDAKNSDDCHLYVKPSISTNITKRASCPFAEEMCKSKGENIIVDSGFINSHHDLGINAPAEERFDLRLLYNCAPISSEGFKKTVKRSNDSGSPEVVQYFYGNLTYGNTAVNPDEFTGFTYEVYKNLTALSLPGFSTGGTSRVEFNIGITSTNGGIYDFTPIPQLARDDADTVLIYLDAQGVAFADKIDDLWFSAHEKWLISLTTDDLPDGVAFQYLVDEPASTLGCTQQVQFCNPGLPRDKGCEPLQPLRPLLGPKNHSEALWSKSQLDALKWAETSLWQDFTHPEIVVGSIGTSVLTARYNLANGICGRLPNNQWQIEIEQFLATTLASLQGSFVEVANGPRDQRAEEYQSHPETDQARKMCRNQKIRSNLYSSLRVVPLAIIFILGTLLIALDITLEPMLNSLQNRRAKHLPQYRVTRASHSRLEWRTMSFLQLQRMAHESIGSGTWLKTTSETPITVPYQELGMLDIRDQKRPLLRAGTDELKGWYAAPDSPTTTVKSQTALKSPIALEKEVLSNEKEKK